MRAIQRNTRIKWHNPTGELINIMTHKINVYRRFKRRYNRSRYDLGAYDRFPININGYIGVGAG